MADGRVADRLPGLGRDPDGDELLDRPPSGASTPRAPYRARELDRQLDDPQEHGFERVLRRERHTRLDQSTVRVPGSLGHRGSVAPVRSRPILGRSRPLTGRPTLPAPRGRGEHVAQRASHRSEVQERRSGTDTAEHVGQGRERRRRRRRRRADRAGLDGDYGGIFADNVRDRLEPQNIVFPPAEAMTPEEKAELEFAGEQVDTGTEAYSRYIGGHLAEERRQDLLGDLPGSCAGRERPGPRRAGCDGADASRETLRSILLNAYGWWTVGTITLWAGLASVLAGVLLGILAILGPRSPGHGTETERTTTVPELADATD